MSAGLQIQIEDDQGALMVRLEGRLDAASAPVLERKLIEQIEKGKAKLVLDFAKVDYLSSAGMRLLLSTTKKLKGNGGGLHLCSVGEEVMEIIKMAGFERIIHIFPTEQEALQGF
ncbi:STAS domain-containing protein [Candidatus Neptunochlamydia vexilliferae]|nr:STAS domain-containing protein [Candidatus Neptunochlamydia vexilliferae]